MLITSLSNNPRRSSFDSVHSLNEGEFNINRSRRSSAISIKRRVRFRSRDFIRRRSSSFVDLPSRIIGTGISRRIDSSLPRFTRKKSSSIVLSEKDHSQINSFEHFQKSSNFPSNKKVITSHSMITKNMRLPPTASVVIKPSFETTTSTNNIRKTTLNIKDITPSQRPLTARSIPDPSRKNTKPDFDLTIKSFRQNIADINDDKNSSND
jgi:hypothetical protein